MSRDLLQDAAARGIRYLESLRTRPVRPDPAAVERLSAAWGGAMPMDRTDDREVLRLLDELGGPATMAMAGPRFFG